MNKEEKPILNINSNQADIMSYQSGSIKDIFHHDSRPIEREPLQQMDIRHQMSYDQSAY